MGLSTVQSHPAIIGAWKQRPHQGNLGGAFVISAHDTQVRGDVP